MGERKIHRLASEIHTSGKVFGQQDQGPSRAEPNPGDILVG